MRMKKKYHRNLLLLWIFPETVYCFDLYRRKTCLCLCSAVFNHFNEGPHVCGGDFSSPFVDLSCQSTVYLGIFDPV